MKAYMSGTDAAIYRGSISAYREAQRIIEAAGHGHTIASAAQLRECSWEAMIPVKAALAESLAAFVAS